MPVVTFADGNGGFGRSSSPSGETCREGVCGDTTTCPGNQFCLDGGNGYNGAFCFVTGQEEGIKMFWLPSRDRAKIDLL